MEVSRTCMTRGRPSWIHYSAGGTEIAVELTDVTLAEAASPFFRSYRLDSEEANSDLKPGVSVREVAGFYVLELDGVQVAECSSIDDVIVEYEFALSCALLDSCSHYTHVHASGAVIGDNAILALGAAGAGKSSLALGWSRAGYPSLGDDTVFLTSDTLVRSFRRIFKVSPAVVTSFGLDLQTTPFWTSSAEEAWYAPDDGGGWASSARVALVAVSRFRSDAPLSIEPIKRSEALSALLNSVMSTGTSVAQAFDPLAQVAMDAAAVRVTFGSAAEAAEALAALVK